MTSSTDVSDGLRDIERRFWKAESTWADKGSGMTKEQQTGAHMAFQWLRTSGLSASTPLPDEGLRKATRAITFHEALNSDPLLPDCSGTHAMGYAYCQRLAALASSEQETGLDAALRTTTTPIAGSRPSAAVRCRSTPTGTVAVPRIKSATDDTAT